MRALTDKQEREHSGAEQAPQRLTFVFDTHHEARP
jgi:hypothetical protein